MKVNLESAIKTLIYKYEKWTKDKENSNQQPYIHIAIYRRYNNTLERRQSKMYEKLKEYHKKKMEKYSNINLQLPGESVIKTNDREIILENLKCDTKEIIGFSGHNTRKSIKKISDWEGTKNKIVFIKEKVIKEHKFVPDNLNIYCNLEMYEEPTNIVDQITTYDFNNIDHVVKVKRTINGDDEEVFDDVVSLSLQLAELKDRIKRLEFGDEVDKLIDLYIKQNSEMLKQSNEQLEEVIQLVKKNNKSSDRVNIKHDLIKIENSNEEDEEVDYANINFGLIVNSMNSNEDDLENSDYDFG